jgi:hypothetical protein
MLTDAETSKSAHAFVAPNPKLVANPIANTLLMLFTIFLSFGFSPLSACCGPNEKGATQPDNLQALEESSRKRGT